MDDQNIPAIVRFYQETGTDNRGRTFRDILEFSREQLENVHDYIQWLFPLPEPSEFNLNAPILTTYSRPIIAEQKEQIIKATSLLLEFYGYRLWTISGVDMVIRNMQYRERTAQWVTRGNHNYLRITRILKFLFLVGQDEIALAFLGRLIETWGEYRDEIGDSVLYWTDSHSATRT